MPALKSLALLLFAVAIGAAHVVLGLVLGAWQAVRFRERPELLDKLGSLLVLGGLFGLAGALYPKLDWAPQPLRAKTTLLALGRSADELAEQDFVRKAYVGL